MSQKTFSAVAFASVSLLAAALAQTNTATPQVQVNPELQRQLQQQEDLGKVQRQQLENLRKEIAQLSADEQKTLRELDAINAEIDRLEGSSASLQAQIKRVDEQLKTTSREVEAIEHRVADLSALVSLSLNAMYRESFNQSLTVMSQNRTLPELILRLGWLNAAAEQQSEVIATLQNEQGNLTAKRGRQQNEQQQLKLLEQEHTAALADLASKRAEARNMLANLQKTASGRRLLEVQGQAELQQTAKNIQELLDIAAKEREAALEAHRKAQEEKQRREAATAERLRQAQRQAQTRGAVGLAPGAVSASNRSAASPAKANRSATEAGAPLVKPADAAAAAAKPTPPAGKVNPEALQGVSAAEMQEGAAEAQRLQDNLQTAEAEEATATAALGLPPVDLDAVLNPVVDSRVVQAYAPEMPWTVLQSASGAEVRSVAAGVVVSSLSFGALQRVVTIDHGNEVLVAYMGLQDVSVVAGDSVEAGQKIGTVGDSSAFGEGSMSLQFSRSEDGRRMPFPTPSLFNRL